MHAGVHKSFIKEPSVSSSSVFLSGWTPFLGSELFFFYFHSHGEMNLEVTIKAHTFTLSDGVCFLCLLSLD